MLLNATVLIKKKTAASYDENAINPDNSVALYIMEQAAVKRGCIKKGNNIDMRKYLILF